MIVTVGSIRGAPGVTSWSLLLGLAWPCEFSGRRVVLEADPAGGVVGARYGLGVEPGSVRMVASARRNGTSAIVLDGVARELEGGLMVVPGPESAEHARSVWTEGAASIAAQAAGDCGVWFVDAGRLDDANPSTAFVDHSVLAVLVVGARPEDLVQLPTRVETLRRRCGAVAVLVSGECTFDAGEIAEFCRADAAWVVTTRDDLIDEVGRLLGGGRTRRWWLGGHSLDSWLWRRSLDVAAGAFGVIAARVPISEASG